MIENVAQLAPHDGRQWRALRTRTQHPKRDQALDAMRAGSRHGVPKQLILEGPTNADCLIDCEQALIWIEGKRNDWLTPSTKWDVVRDQLARNLEAAFILASQEDEPTRKDFCVLIVHEYPLKYHERLLVDGYRAGTWAGGCPHLDESMRKSFQTRIGTLTWAKLAEEWPALQDYLECG